MSEGHLLRVRMQRLRTKTTSAEGLQPLGWFEGDKAGETRAFDDLRSGVEDWRNAYSYAERALQALDADDIESARRYAWIATDHYVKALEALVRPGDLETLGQPAQRRGRPKSFHKKGTVVPKN